MQPRPKKLLDQVRAVEVKKPGFSQEAGFLLLRYGHPGGAEEAGLSFVPHLHEIGARRLRGNTKRCPSHALTALHGDPRNSSFLA